MSDDIRGAAATCVAEMVAVTPSNRVPAAIVQIVPTGEGGVRDCAGVLQQHWAALGQRSACISLDEAAASGVPLARQLLSADLGWRGQSAERPLLALLHYSGYGYQPRGLPYWLLREIDRARRNLPGGLRLGVYFHELQASGPPWRSAFWLGGLQAQLGRQLARCADALWTNTEAHGTWLRHVLGASKPGVSVRPVVSTIGEPYALELTAEREPAAVVFGAPSTRARALHGAARHAAELRRHGVRRLLEIGPGGASAAAVDGLTVDFRGCLPAHDVGALLAGCRYGLIDYPSDMLGKSSVFAALAAHGLTVLNARAPRADADGLRRDSHYVALGTGVTGLAQSGRAPDIGQAAFRWYAPHRAAVQAAQLARLLQMAAVGASSHSAAHTVDLAFPLEPSP